MRKTELNIFEHPAIVYWRAIVAGDLETADAIEGSTITNAEFSALKDTVYRLITLSNEISFLERRIKGHTKEALHPLMQELLDEGVTIPIELLQRAYDIIFLSGKRAGQKMSPEEKIERQKIAGHLRALADVKGRGAMGLFHKALRQLALKNYSERECQKEADVLLASPAARNVRYMDKITLQRCFTVEEIRQLTFPDKPAKYLKYINEIHARRKKWSNERPQEFLRAVATSKRAGLTG